jgi:CheY-like chemotaxis protein
MKFLIVDDGPIILKLMQSVLEESGRSVPEALPPVTGRSQATAVCRITIGAAARLVPAMPPPR